MFSPLPFKSGCYLLGFLFLFVTQKAVSQIVINEGSNRNYLSVPDEDGEYPDWVELYNAGSQAVNLLDYSITDKQSNARKWIFPEVVLPPGGFLLVYCSGKDRRPDEGFKQVVYETSFNPQLGWNTHFFNSAFLWDGQTDLVINTCSYSSAGYTSNSVFNQSATDYLSTVYSFVDGSEGACQSDYGIPAYLRPNLQLNGITIGTGEIQNGNTAYPAPYGNWYWCARNQMLIHASELTAAGVEPGFMSSIGFDVAATDPNTVYDYLRISMNAVNTESLTSAFLPSEPTFAFHTNFKLSSDGETVYLFSPSQQLLSSLMVEANDLDNSRGSVQNGSAETAFFQSPTPASSNNNSPAYTSYLLPATLSEASGIFSESFSLLMSQPNGETADIRYTTDGSDPTPNSLLYHTGNPLTVTQTTLIKARVYQDGMLPSPLVAASYLFDAEHTTPVLSVLTDNSNLYGGSGIFDNWWTDWERAAYVDYFDSTKQLIFSQRTGIQMDGGYGGSRSQPQRSFRLEVADGVLGANPVDYPIIPQRPDRVQYSKFYLRNGSNQYLVLPYKDACQVASMGNGNHSYYSAWRPVTVYINGQYFGLYELREKMDAEYFELLDGADPDETTILSQSAWYNGVLRPVEGTVEPFFASWNVCRVLNPEDDDFWEQTDTHFDLVSYTDYIIGESWMGNVDWPWNNIKIYRSDATNYRWRFCLIDQELAMLPNGWTDCNFDHIGYMLGQDPANPYIGLWLKGIQNERFRNYFINRFADLMNSSYRYDRLYAIENTMYQLTFPEMPNEFARWGDPNNIPQQMFGFTNNHLSLRNQFSLRTDQVRNHILSHADLPNLVDVTLNVDPPESGIIHISTLTPDEYPWQGVYFNGIPVGLSAEAAPGYIFTHWSPNAVLTDTTSPTFTGILNAQSLTFTAHFEDETTANGEIHHTESGWKLFPNPAVNLLFLKGKPMAGLYYQLVGQLGKTEKTGLLEKSETNSIDIRFLTPGSYTLQLTEASGLRHHLKFIKLTTR